MLIYGLIFFISSLTSFMSLGSSQMLYSSRGFLFEVYFFNEDVVSRKKVLYTDIRLKTTSTMLLFPHFS